ncbi:MAG: response regulator [Fibromonadaceae bacterium]|jgi:signal transduction histidine kinase/CheY-like chemotaxis protein|nr:response regulator [Fibromonadaceae bacterium]
MRATEKNVVWKLREPLTRKKKKLSISVLMYIAILILLVFTGISFYLHGFNFYFIFILCASFFLLFQAYRVSQKEDNADRAFMVFSALLRNTPNYMAITNSRRQVRYLSYAMAKFLQCDRELAIGQPLVDLVTNKNLKKMFSDILDSDDFFEAIVPLNMEDRERYFKVISDKLPNEIGGQFIDISDITATVKSQKAAEEAQLAAVSANAAKSKFLATMSHEIRTPMNAIIGITEIELNKEEHLKEIRDSFRRIYNSGYTLLGIINDILDLSKIESGKLEINPIKYDIASLINDTVQLNIMRLGSKQIELELRISEDLPAYLIGDDLRVKQVLNNLLSNAFKYTNKGKVTLEFKAEAISNAEIHLIIIVSDTGQGMSSEQVAKLFEEYSRFNMEANRTTEGTGLGLSITKKLIELMQGSIAVESELGKGSVFTVRLSQQAVECAAIGKELAENLQNFSFAGESQAKKTRITREYMPYGKVLVVDDIETNLFVAKGLLQPYGLKIETANSGFEAIDKIRSGNIYDIVFMDHMMPQMDGIEAVKRIRAMGYAHSIVALTANAVAGQAEIFAENGFDAFVSKPIDIRQLNTVLNKMIRDKQSPETIEAAQRQKATSDISKNTLTNAALLAVFAQDTKKVLPVLEGIFKNIDNTASEELRLFAINAHAMKSALANIGEKEASEQAALLEKAGKEQDKNAIQAKTQNFIDSLRAIVEKIEANAPPSASEDEDPAYLKEQLQIISKACIDYDEQTANIALENLQKMQWTKETKAILDQISQALLFSDFEAAAQKAQKAAQQ